MRIPQLTTVMKEIHSIFLLNIILTVTSELQNDSGTTLE